MIIPLPTCAVGISLEYLHYSTVPISVAWRSYRPFGPKASLSVWASFKLSGCSPFEINRKIEPVEKLCFSLNLYGYCRLHFY